MLDPAIEAILSRATTPILDYGLLMDALKDYQAPRKKIHALIRKGVLVSVKKGLYLLQEPLAPAPYARETLANLIYGPSHVSLEWACQYYGLIPERVEAVTSVTVKRRKDFHTPVGLFSYTHQNPRAFSWGVDLIEFAPEQKAMIASKEKALSDLVTLRRGQCGSIQQMREVLFEDLRVDPEELLDLNLESLETIYSQYPHSAVKYLIQTVEKELRS